MHHHILGVYHKLTVVLHNPLIYIGCNEALYLLLSLYVEMVSYWKLRIGVKLVIKVIISY